MSENPYQAPSVMVASSDGGADPTLEGAVDMLRQTKPWVRFISVMMFICSALMVLVGVFMMVGLFMMGGGAAGGSARVSMVAGVVYIVMALLYIIPAVFLWKYADRIALFVQERSTGTLAFALEAQKSFWKFVGIVILVIMAIYAVFFAFAIVAGVVSSIG